VSVILRKNEYTDDSNCLKPVKSYDMNTLKSNNPIEDSHAEACLTANSSAGMLFGIFDGHGGPACGQVRQVQTVIS
jgi:pyruvate dehydrogenase phosphatase